MSQVCYQKIKKFNSVAASQNILQNAPWTPKKEEKKFYWSQESRSPCHWPTQVYFQVHRARMTCYHGCWRWWSSVKKQKQHCQVLQRATMSVEAVLNRSWMRSGGRPLSPTLWKLCKLPKKIGACKTLWEFSEKTIFELISTVWI